MAHPVLSDISWAQCVLHATGEEIKFDSEQHARTVTHHSLRSHADAHARKSTSALVISLHRGGSVPFPGHLLMNEQQTVGRAEHVQTDPTSPCVTPPPPHQHCCPLLATSPYSSHLFKYNHSSFGLRNRRNSVKVQSTSQTWITINLHVRSKTRIISTFQLEKNLVFVCHRRLLKNWQKTVRSH